MQDMTDQFNKTSVVENIGAFMGVELDGFLPHLYEYYVIKKLRIKKKQKNISLELLKNFDQRLSAEDISRSDMQSISVN